MFRLHRWERFKVRTLFPKKRSNKRYSAYVVTPTRVYRKFSSTIRPDDPATQAQMRKLEAEGLGEMKKVDRTVLFYKALPMAIVPKQLDIYGISLEEYKETFPRTDPGPTDLQRITAEENHPDFDAYKEYRNENSQ